MKGFQYSDKDILLAFMKTAQYLASLTTHEDVWDHIAQLMVKFYGVDSTGFARRRADGEIEIHHLVTSDRLCLFSSKQIQEIVCEVVETGFLAWRSFGAGDEPYMVVFLPVAIGNQIAGVMMVGHATAGPIPNDLLNVYLAVAGLAGATITKLISETELKKHRTHLEKLVSARTGELTRTLDRLGLEITEHMKAEEELRTIRDHLEELVEQRTAELEKANQELKAYSEKLERINEELEEFAFVASHDLQEPLRKIQTFCDMAKKRCAPALDNTSNDYLDRVVNSASRMRQLLADLLQFSRVATKLEPFKKIEIDRIVREAADIFEASVKQTGCEIEIGKIPGIEADESQMLRLFQNLIGNALKFRGRETPRIWIYGRLGGQGMCEISVKDNGIGFEQQLERLIFKPFQRLHGRSEYDGTGMGLAICRKIVERHGGNIRAESEPGKGSTFIIRMPVKQTRFENFSSGGQ